MDAVVMLIAAASSERQLPPETARFAGNETVRYGRQ
jgi:hypothetical protein